MLAVPAREYSVDEAALVAAVASDVHLRVVSTLAASSPIRTADTQTDHRPLRLQRGISAATRWAVRLSPVCLSVQASVVTVPWTTTR
jgi:hypothetical protein